MSATVILNVDDNEAARYAKTRSLGARRLPVIEARTGAEAMEWAKKERAGPGSSRRPPARHQRL